MIPNNKYYKDIAVILGYEWDNKHHSSLVYMKEIAMAYGYSYETTKPSNKFLKDWHTGLTGETPSDHKYNLYYLRGIAEFLGSSTGLNENQCLAYIKDNIENPPSEFDSIVLTVTTPILSYADGDSTSLSAQLTYQGEPAHLSGKSVSFDVIDGQGTVLSHIGDGVTNANGVAVSDNDYVSSGVGDVSITARVGSLVSEIYEVHDYWKYIASGSKTVSTTSHTQFDIADLNDLTGDYEISVTLKSNATKGFGMCLNNATATSNQNLFRVGVSSGNNSAVVRMGNGAIAEGYDSTTTYTANTDVVLKLQRVNGVYTGYIDSFSHSYSNAPSNPRYLQLESWISSKTLTYTDFIVKPL